MPRTASRIFSAGAAVAVAAASILVTATPAAAATMHVPASAIAPDETAYLGWHAQVATGDYVDAWNGLRIGDGADTYLLNGLVSAGQPGVAVTATELGTLITTSVVSGAGDLRIEVPISVGAATPPLAGSWGTLFSADPTADVSPALTDEWISTQAITLNGAAIPANTRMALSDILAQLAIAGDVKYSGFGFHAAGQSPAAVVSSMTWGADSFTFGRTVTPVAPSSTVVVVEGDIRPDESTYPGWHEGYVNATPAYSVESDGLHLGNGAGSQIINGLTTPLATADPFSLLSSAAVTVASGTAFYQVPVFYGPGSTFTTLRSAGAGLGTTSVALTDVWTSSNPIPASATTAPIAADTPVPLGDLLEALLAQGGTLEVLAFGVLADASAPAVVSAIVWNGVTYSFVPTLAATGIDPSLALGGAGSLLLAGAVLVLLRRRIASAG